MENFLKAIPETKPTSFQLKRERFNMANLVQSATYIDTAGVQQKDRRSGALKKDRIHIKSGIFELELPLPSGKEDLVFDKTIKLMDQTQRRERASEIQAWITAGFMIIAGSVMTIGAVKGLSNPTYSNP
jgi:hypothetical protein